MVEEGLVELLACTPDSLIPLPEVPGLGMVPLDENSTLTDVREGLDTNERGFHPRAEPVNLEQAQAFPEGLVESKALTARIDGAPAGDGTFNPPHGGVTELVGIATVDALRGRGVAPYLTAYASRSSGAWSWPT